MRSALGLETVGMPYSWKGPGLGAALADSPSAYRAVASWTLSESDHRTPTARLHKKIMPQQDQDQVLENQLKGKQKKFDTILDFCVSSLRRGHANLLCIVPILTDDSRRRSVIMVNVLSI